MFCRASNCKRDRQSITFESSLLQQKCGDDLIGLGRIGGAAIDAEPVCAADEFVVNDLTVEVCVFHEGSRITVRAVSWDACGIAQLRPGFTHPLGEAIDALLAVHESSANTASSRVRNSCIGSAADGNDPAPVGRDNYLVIGVVARGIEPK